MKKFISMVMAAAMVVSLVPATAFAAVSATATAKVVDAYEVTAEDVENNGRAIATTEIQLVLGDVNTVVAQNDSYEVKVKLTNADFANDVVATAPTGTVYRAEDSGNKQVGTVTVKEAITANDDTTFTIVVTESADFRSGDIVKFTLGSTKFTKDTAGTEAKVAFSGDFGSIDAVTYAAIVAEGIEAELEDDCVDVAPEEIAEIETIVIEPNVGTTFDSVVDTTKVTETSLKLNKGFEFVGPFDIEYFDAAGNSLVKYASTAWAGFSGLDLTIDEDEIEFDSNLTGVAKIEITGLEVEATTADAGDVANVKVKMGNLPSVTVEEVAKVVEYKVVMTLVDEDEDVPVFYNGVDVENTGLTVDDDHEALAVNIAETFKGAWSNHKEFTLSLPEGVHVAGVTDIAGDMDGTTVATMLQNAYIKGDHEEFVFAKRAFNETVPASADLNEMEFALVLVAEPDFVGDVVLTLEGAALETQEVTIAKFVAPYTIKAEQNDVIIDYRYTEVDTDIVITEAEAGLWAEGLEVAFAVERGAWIQFEDDAVIAVNEESDMEIEDEFTLTATPDPDATGTFIQFRVDEESDEEPAVVTISGIELFMQRSIPAGPYSLDVVANSATEAFLAEGLYAPVADEAIVDDVDDFSTTAHEAWINVVTAGRDKDDASFTTTVVVPVGETTMYAGDKAYTLDVPAYINANGYTMLPVRAVAVALGIDNDAVQWDNDTKTVIIMYGQRVITMTAGQKVVYASGTAIPAKSAVEIVDGRAFLGLRDLATALGVTDVNWDDTTKTATLN